MSKNEMKTYQKMIDQLTSMLKIARAARQSMTAMEMKVETDEMLEDLANARLLMIKNYYCFEDALVMPTVR